MSHTERISGYFLLHELQRRTLRVATRLIRNRHTASFTQAIGLATVLTKSLSFGAEVALG